MSKGHRWTSDTARDAGRQGGAVSAHTRRGRIIARLLAGSGHLAPDARIVEAYKQGYKTGYMTAKRRWLSIKRH